MGNKAMNKKVYLEMLRIIACGMVIFNHLPGFRYYYFVSGKRQFLSICISAIVKSAVPIFFMISGAVLLGREDEWLMVIKKRAIRVLFIIFLFEFLVMSIVKIKSVQNGVDYEYTFSAYFRGALCNSIEGAGAYWYLYSYLGLLLVLPMMQRVAQHITKIEMHALILLHFVKCSFLPIVNEFMRIKQMPTYSLNDAFYIPFAFSAPFFFTLLGFYLDNHVDITKIKLRHLAEFTIVLAGVLLITYRCVYAQGNINGEFTEDYIAIFDYVIAIYAFVLAKYLWIKGNVMANESKLAQIVCFCGSLTFGIYLFDPCIKKFLYIGMESWVDNRASALIVGFMWVIVSMILGGTIIWALKKIPGVRKFI
nr:acyltransferase [uncultured Butyrivibrio sp.]